MHILPAYAAVLALLFVGLSLRTLRLRQRLKIGIGDAGNPVMLRAMRVHSNFAEYVPLALLLIHFTELRGAPAGWVHALAASLVVGRVAHALGVSRTNENYAFRVAGMLLTFTAIVGAAALLLLGQWHGVQTGRAA